MVAGSRWRAAGGGVLFEVDKSNLLESARDFVDKIGLLNKGGLAEAYGFGGAKSMRCFSEFVMNEMVRLDGGKKFSYFSDESDLRCVYRRCCDG